ncbi:MAG: RDD family protein [Tepidisphaeraceae bacterium]
MNRWIFCAFAWLLVFAVSAVRAEITAVQPIGEGEQTWLICTDTTKDKPVGTIVRRLADPLKGVWVESLRLSGKFVDVAAVEDRVALLAEDGSWRLAWDGASVGGPKPPDGYRLRKIASDGSSTLWAIAEGPNNSGSLLKWREQDGWSIAQTLPDGVAMNAFEIGVIAGEPWIAYLRSQAINLMRLTDGGWKVGPSIEVPQSAWFVGSYAFVPDTDKPVLSIKMRETGLSLLFPGPPVKMQQLPRMGETLMAGPVLKLFHLKDGKIEQTTVDDGGLGSPFGPVAVPDPVRPRQAQQEGEWINLLVLAALTVLTLRALRNRPEEPLSVAGSLTPALIVRRFAAAVIDAGPCVAIGVWVFSAFGGTLEDARGSGLPVVLATYLSLLGYLAHVAACEVAFGRSLGKWLLGLKVLSIDGTRATAGQILMRNLLRLLEIQLVLPMFIVLFTPTGQRLGDLAARTTVTIDSTGSETPPPDAGDGTN